MGDVSISSVLSQVLYCLSGYFFGMFASRFGVISFRNLKYTLQEPNDFIKLVSLLFYAAAIAVLWVAFPAVLARYTQAGGIVMLVTTAYYVRLALRLVYHQPQVIAKKQGSSKRLKNSK